MLSSLISSTFGTFAEGFPDLNGLNHSINYRLINESEDPRSLSSTLKTQFRPLSDIVTEESKYYPEHEEEKILEDDNEDLEMNEEEHLTSKQKVASKKLDKDAKYKRIETLNSLGYSAAQIAADSQVNMNIRTIKRIRSKIRTKGGIHRNEGSGRPVKLLDHHQSFESLSFQHCKQACF